MITRPCSFTIFLPSAGLVRLQERLSISARHSHAAALAALRASLSELLHTAAQRRDQAGDQLPVVLPPPGELCGAILCLLVRLAGRPGSGALRESQLAAVHSAACRPGRTICPQRGTLKAASCHIDRRLAARAFRELGGSLRRCSVRQL